MITRHNPPKLEKTLISLAEFVAQQVTFSREAFGPNTRTRGVIDHIKKELVEVEESDGSINEWVDVALLALDGMQRAATKSLVDRGVEATPELVALDVCDCLRAKLHTNINRDWPDWRTVDPDKAIEHNRS